MAEQEEEGSSERWVEECHNLLMALKSTIEGILAMQSSNVWSTYGGFKRVCGQMESVLSHRIKHSQMHSPSDGVFWSFIRGLKWLRPGMTSTLEQVRRAARSGNHSGLGQLWLHESLQNHTLSSQLAILASDPEHLRYHYHDGAFLRNSDFVQAMLICLRAVELNKVAVLADIDPKILQKRTKSIHYHNSPSTSPSVMSVDDLYADIQSVPVMHPAYSISRGTETLSPPRPDVMFSISGDHSGGAGAESTHSAEVSVPSCTMPSADRYTTSPTLNVFISSSPNTISLYDHTLVDPLSSIYSTSPPLIEEHPPVFHNIQDHPQSQSRLGQHRETLRKCLSESYASDSFQQYHLTGCKEVYIPPTDTSGDNNEKNVRSNPRLGTSNGAVSAGVKHSVEVASIYKLGHKRSQSDFGVGAASARNSDFAPSPDLGNGAEPSEGKTAESAASSAAGKTSQRTSQASIPGLHRRDSFFQPPAKGQSLVSYLSEQDFNCCATLETENAHFTIADILISVFEQMKWENTLKRQSLMDTVSDEEESDDEIAELKQRIRIRRRERLVEKSKRFSANSDGMNDTNTGSSQAASSPFSSHDFSSLSGSSDSEELDSELELTSADLQKRGKSPEPTGLDQQGSTEKSNFSAEAIALSLLSQFSEKRLPKASELDWLVSEKDVPQALLPLPNSYPISPDDGENADLMQTAYQTKLRGNLEWAPPRAQIIFTVHSQEKRSVVLSRQNMRCAGCGAKTEPGFVKRLRYCEYMGKYFCQCCHSNSMEVIPGRIIMRWDFTQYYVSNFARDVLQKIHQQPLFHVEAINPALYRKVRLLDTVRDLRRQLGHLIVFLNICRRSTKLLEEMTSLRRHWAEDDDIYSVEDFLMVRSGEMVAQLKQFVSEAISHVEGCQLCQGLGFICELCQDQGVIFPFQLGRVTLCPVCQACFHRSCFIPGKCPKCSRMEIRRKRQTQISPSTETPPSEHSNIKEQKEEVAASS
ncbi:run domain Beclin-1-interacting and cysteine-rich domain-containing protein-like isoform X2 [Pomacea canaliculata]|uniref:run domain Beclin-1-interacting and cysteine-rich domain-containing protein-like isoform X2 n=1 Tax=Pomacea canaliculata TaxID=400727 RepID=UPI000D73BDB5|nr:run domain Beclin-1-interacting and cysteine-rich domain-containing protein-like isoform X2 [Pomacea canaliculata]